MPARRTRRRRAQRKPGGGAYAVRMARSATGEVHRGDRNATADRAVDLLLLFDDRSPRLSAMEVSEKLGMSRSTTYRYLMSLRAYGLLEEDTMAGVYRLGPRWFKLARVARAGLPMIDLAVPVMRELARTIEETVMLSRRSGSLIICIERVESGKAVRLTYERGAVVPVHTGAGAKVLMAHADPAEVDAILGTTELKAFTERTITDPDELRAHFRELAAQPWVFSDGELDAGIRGVGAPVFGPNGRIVASLAMAGLAAQLPDDLVNSVGDAVREAADAITAKLAGA